MQPRHGDPNKSVANAEVVSATQSLQVIPNLGQPDGASRPLKTHEDTDQSIMCLAASTPMSVNCFNYNRHVVFQERGQPQI